MNNNIRLTEDEIASVLKVISIVDRLRETESNFVSVKNGIWFSQDELQHLKFQLARLTNVRTLEKERR